MVPLLRQLAASVRAPASHLAAAESAAATATSWADGIEAGADALGMRAQWMVATLGDALELVEDNQYLAIQLDQQDNLLLHRGANDRIVTIRLLRNQRVRLNSTALQELLGDGAHTWFLLEPVLPATPLATPKGAPRWTAVRRLRALLDLERGDVTTITLFGVVAGALALATPLAIQALINWLAFGALIQPVLWLGAVLLFFLATAALLDVQQRIVVEYLRRRLFVRTATDLTERLMRADLEGLDDRSRSDLANRFFDILTIQKAVGTVLLDGLTALLQVSVALVLLALYHPWLILYDVLLIAGMNLVARHLGRGGAETAVVESKQKFAIADWLHEVARTSAVHRDPRTSLASRTTHQLTEEWLDARESHFRVYLRQITATQVMQVLLSVGLLLACGALVLRGELTLGQLVAAEFTVTIALTGFTKFIYKLDTVYDLVAGADKVGEVLDIPLTEAHGVRTRSESPPAITFDGVKATETDEPLDAELEAGDCLVLADASAGRSPLAEVVAGLRNPRAGIVIRDGVLTTQLSATSAKHRVLLLRPDAHLAVSIRDNLTLGAAGINDAVLLDALREVGLLPLLTMLPNGLDERISREGTPLTLPQRAALLVARALVLRPRLLIVDGLLDALPEDDASELAGILDGPWTLLHLTTTPSRVRRPHVAARIG